MLLRRSVFLTADLGVLALIVGVAWWLVRTPLYASSPELLGLAISVDLTLTAALAHVLLGVLGARLPRWTSLSVLGLGALAAHLLVPQSSAMAVVVGLVELGLLAVVGWTVITMVRRGRQAGHGWGWEGIETSLAHMLESPGLATATVLELRLLWLALTGPLRRTPSGPEVVAMHRESGWMWVSSFLVGLSFIEVPALHLILDYVLQPLAWMGPVWVLPWVLSAASVYGALWLLGDAQALRLHPTRWEEHTLRLAVGLRWHAEIPRDLITGVEPVSDAEEIDLSVFGGPNVRVCLSRPVVIRGLFGARRETDRFSLQVDDVAALVTAYGARRIERPG